MRHHSGNRAARRKNGRVCPRLRRIHYRLECAGHSRVVILPGLNPLDIATRAYPLVEHGCDDFLEGFALCGAPIDKCFELGVPLEKNRRQDFELLVISHLIKAGIDM